MNRIYETNEISVDITKSEMKQLFNLCTKSVHFDYVLEMLTGFHRNIKFTYKVEADSKISFLDVLVMCDSSNNINTTAY